MFYLFKFHVIICFFDIKLKSYLELFYMFNSVNFVKYDLSEKNVFKKCFKTDLFNAQSLFLQLLK
jgi:hypothetical protein